MLAVEAFAVVFVVLLPAGMGRFYTWDIFRAPSPAHLLEYWLVAFSSQYSSEVSKGSSPKYIFFKSQVWNNTTNAPTAIKINMSALKKFEDWKGSTFFQKPFFYQGVYATLMKITDPPWFMVSWQSTSSQDEKKEEIGFGSFDIL